MRTLTGLRADNLLGYLAALGVCRLTNCRLSWAMTGPVECAVLDTDREIDDLADELLERCRQLPVVTHWPDSNLNLDFDEWMTIPDDWAAAISCQNRRGLFRSPLLTCGSNGRQVTRNMVGLSKSVGAEDIRSALAGPWIYREGFGMQWDSVEFRVAGERWIKPTNDESQVAWGPTRLALEALPLWPVLTDRRLTAIQYVTWREPLSPNGVRGRVLSGVGSRTYECDRVTGGKGRVLFDVPRVIG